MENEERRGVNNTHGARDGTATGNNKISQRKSSVNSNGETQQNAGQSPTLAAALHYLDHDCYVIPLCEMTPQGKCTSHSIHSIPNSIGKVPICGAKWQHLRLTREEVIEWWTKHPWANVGILLEPSGLLVIDPDSPEAQEEAARLGLPPGPQIKTGKGTHHYLKNAKGIIASAIQEGKSGSIDVLAQGMVVGAGSIHRSGHRYEWLVTWDEWPELEEAPLWAERLLLDAVKAKGAAVEIPDELTPVDLEVLGIPRWLQDIIVHGQPTRGEKYETRSHAVWAVETALVEAGHSNEIIASILLDRRYRISAKPREAGMRWLAADIGRARAKARKPDPAPTPGDPQPETPDVEEPHTGAAFTTGETEEEENERILKAERPVDELWPCPAHLWRGPFARVAEEAGKATWEVWAATASAISSRAHRNIDYKYHRRLFGMMYILLIKGTGMGKGFSTDLCQALMPDEYVVRDAPQSGQALAPILADILRDNKGKVVSCTSHPALLVIEEFTVLLKNAGIQNSTLFDTINGLFHRTWGWNISRSDRPNSGGGDAVIRNPTLSILATTTGDLFNEHVSPTMIRSGFVNRFLVLPGDTTPWTFHDPDGAGKIVSPQLGILDGLTARKVGDGQTVWDAYEPDALVRMVEWGTAFFEPIMNSGSLDAETVKRLHVYAHIICLTYMWGEHRTRINLPDVECAITTIETADAFLRSLVAAEREPVVPQFKAYEISLEQRILAKVTTAAATGAPRRKVVRDLMGKTATSPDLNHLISKMVQAETIVEMPEITTAGKKPTQKLYLPQYDPEQKK